jgi:microcystin-dependent protein
MDPYLGMMFLFGGNFAIKGFAICQGQFLSISQNTALFSILGTQYGGDGQTTFALPDLRGRVAIGVGTGFDIGQEGGSANTTLLASNIPSHTHALSVNPGPGTTASPGSTAYFAAGAPTGSGPNATLLKIYTTAAPNTNLGPSSIQPFGSGQPFSTISPYLCATYLIALQGIYPSRN